MPSDERRQVSPRPWRVGPSHGAPEFRTIYDANNKPVFVDIHAGGDKHAPDCYADDLEDIVECVNALAGIPDPEAELTRLRTIEAKVKDFLTAVDRTNVANPGAARMSSIEVFYLNKLRELTGGE